MPCSKLFRTPLLVVSLPTVGVSGFPPLHAQNVAGGLVRLLLYGTNRTAGVSQSTPLVAAGKRIRFVGSLRYGARPARGALGGEAALPVCPVVPVVGVSQPDALGKVPRLASEPKCSPTASNTVRSLSESPLMRVRVLAVAGGIGSTGGEIFLTRRLSCKPVRCPTGICGGKPEAKVGVCFHLCALHSTDGNPALRLKFRPREIH